MAPWLQHQPPHTERSGAHFPVKGKHLGYWFPNPCACLSPPPPPFHSLSRNQWKKCPWVRISHNNVRLGTVAELKPGRFGTILPWKPHPPGAGFSVATTVPGNRDLTGQSGHRPGAAWRGGHLPFPRGRRCEGPASPSAGAGWPGSGRPSPAAPPRPPGRAGRAGRSSSPGSP